MLAVFGRAGGRRRGRIVRQYGVDHGRPLPGPQAGVGGRPVGHLAPERRRDRGGRPGVQGEQPADAALARSLGAEIGQGYLWSRPRLLES